MGEYVQIREQIEDIPMGQKSLFLIVAFLWKAKSISAVAWFGELVYRCDNSTEYMSIASENTG